MSIEWRTKAQDLAAVRIYVTKNIRYERKVDSKRETLVHDREIRRKMRFDRPLSRARIAAKAIDLAPRKKIVRVKTSSARETRLRRYRENLTLKTLEMKSSSKGAEVTAATK
eukprot:1395181-Amorphochlora_amoeboformis.AAC.2